MKSNIFLYGPSGSGKSTIGKELANALSMDFLDLDAQIEIDLGDSITNTIQNKGEEVFRDAETKALQDAVLSPPSNSPQDGGRTSPSPILGEVRWGHVVALGGGALLREQNQRIAEENGQIIFLEADVDTLLSHLADDANKRPLLAGELREKLNALLTKRAAHYGAFPLRVNAAQTVEQIVWDIQVKLGRFHSASMETGYDILVEDGGIDGIGEMLVQRHLSGPILLVSDSNVAPIYAERVIASLEKAGFSATQTVIPAGEANKTLETVHQLWAAALHGDLDRKSTIVALGGGMSTDLAGFTAATFMRGCNWVALPTSLLGMVDASMGGKTGFDLDEGKNLVGAFYPPRLVMADPETLATLPARELRSGMAEALKHGIITDPELFELCKNFTTEHTERTESLKNSEKNSVISVNSVVNQIVRRGMSVKVKVIAEDPYEHGIRAALNLGHTIGHAVELVSGFELLHGEAIGIGMIVEAKLAEKLGIAESGLADKIAAALVDLGLPVEIPKHLPIPDILRIMQHDKKKAKGVVKFALPVKIGEVKVGVVIENLEKLLDEVMRDA